MISFIIPTYNRAERIRNAINCVLRQGETIWELIIVDDGSVDNTKIVINPFLIDPRIRYIYQENQGVAVARNQGAKIAKGQYLIFLDSDDTLDPNLIHLLQKNNYTYSDLIFWHLQKITDSVSEVVVPRNMGYLYNYKTVQFLAGSVCYRKEIFEKAGGYDPEMTFGENYELGIRICKIDNLKILNIKEVLATYYIETLNRTSNVVTNKLPSLIHQYKKHQNLFAGSRFEKSKMLYFFAYLLEISNKNKWAKRFYGASWKVAPWRPKPFLKFVLLNLK